MDLTKEEVIARVVFAFVTVALIVMTAMSCSAAYIQVPNIGAIMDEVRASAKKAADEIAYDKIAGDALKNVDFSGVIDLDINLDAEEPELSQMELFEEIVESVKRDIPTYDMGTSSLSKALQTGKGNCLAYSLYTKIACDSAGIPCYVVFATKDPGSISAGMHIWNRVTINGCKYWCDMSSYVLGYGDTYKLSKTIPASHKGYSNYYVLNVKKGTYKELVALKKNFVYKDEKTTCSAANQTAKLAKNEYAKCKE